MIMTVVRSKSRGVQLNGDHMFWGTKIIGPPDSEVRVRSFEGDRLIVVVAIPCWSISCLLPPGVDKLQRVKVPHVIDAYRRTQYALWFVFIYEQCDFTGATTLSHSSRSYATRSHLRVVSLGQIPLKISGYVMYGFLEVSLEYQE